MMFGELVRLFSGKARPGRVRDAVTDATTVDFKWHDRSFRLLFDSNPIPMWVMDIESLKLLAVNDAAVKHYGFTREKFSTMTVLDIRLPQDRDSFTEYMHSGANSQGRKIWHHRKANGDVILVSVYSGDLTYTGAAARLCAVIDVTEQIQAKEKLLEQKVQIDTALNNMSQGVLMFDSDGRLLLCNRRYIEMYNLSPDTVRPGCTLRELIEHRKAVGLFFGDTDSYCAEVMAAVAKGATTNRIIELPDARTIHAVNHPMADGGWVATHEDITERKRSQARLSQETNENRRLFETSLDLILVTNSFGKFERVSPISSSILGYSPEEMVGRIAIDFVHPDDLESTRNEMRLARRGKLMRNFVTRYMHKEGRVVTLSWSGLWSEPTQQYFFTGRDMTEQRAAEEKLRATGEQLKQAQKMESIGQLTGGIAHDFNNMLTVITGTIDILAEAVADKPQLAAIAKLISEAADRGAELTGHLLSFARKQPLQPRETNINALVIESGKLLRPALGEGIEIELGLQETAWPAMVDPGQLASALLNLAVNARDAMPNGGKLTLETRNVTLDQNYVDSNTDIHPGNYLQISVSDTGCGIPEAVRQKIFEPFFTTKGVGKGTGLGLSMVYGFVKQSGGHIKVYSEEGHGTTFKIYLPCAAAHPESIAGLLQEPESDIVGGSETILIVEDDLLVRTSVTAQILSLGYKTLSAGNAAEALAIADSGAMFDLLFTDVIMPGQMNGRLLVEEMAKRRAALRVLFTSGYTENAIIHHGRLDPGVLLLAKPYRKQELARMLRKALHGNPTMPTHDHYPSKSQAV